MNRKIKYLGLLLVMLLGLYPIVELTRVIIVSGTYYFPEMDGQFIAETVVMWILYLSIIPVFLAIHIHKLHYYRKVKKDILKQTEDRSRFMPLTGEDNNFIRVDYRK